MRWYLPWALKDEQNLRGWKLVTRWRKIKTFLILSTSLALSIVLTQIVFPRFVVHYSVSRMTLLAMTDYLLCPRKNQSLNWGAVSQRESWTKTWDLPSPLSSEGNGFLWPMTGGPFIHILHIYRLKAIVFCLLFRCFHRRKVCRGTQRPHCLACVSTPANTYIWRLSFNLHSNRKRFINA